MKKSGWFKDIDGKKFVKIDIARSGTEKDVLDEYARLVELENEKEGYREKIKSIKEDKVEDKD